MSLYIGKLSSRTHREELENVFRRFGRCNVQLKKEGYGFVVFDFPPDAEKALRALKGRNVCGEPLSLEWSNQQPKSFQRIARGAKSYGFQHGRKSERVDYPRRKIGYNGWREKRTIKEQEINDGKVTYTNVGDEERVQGRDSFEEYAGNVHENYKDSLLEKRGGDGNNIEDHGRWGEQVSDMSSQDNNQNDIFDRYEPYKCYDGKDCEEDYHAGYPPVSPVPEASLGVVDRAVVNDMALIGLDKSELPQACYICGEPGHKKRNCPKADASHGHSGRSDKQLHKHTDRSYRGEDELGGSSSTRDQRRRRDGFSTRQLRNDRRVSRYVHNQLSTKEALTVSKETDSHGGKDYREKKRRRKETKVSRKPNAKKLRSSLSSSKHSDEKVARSRSVSHSFKSLRQFTSHSKSGSVFSQAHSLSSNLKSSSKSWDSRSKSPKARRSSSPTSLSLSVSDHHHQFPYSLQEVQNPKDYSVNATAPETYNNKVERKTHMKGELVLEDDSDNETILAVNNRNTVPKTNRMERRIENNHSMKDVESSENHKLNMLSDLANDPTDAIPHAETLTLEKLPQHTFIETQDVLDSGATLIEHVSTNITNSDPVTCMNCHSGHSTRISLEELYMVLKHYDLEVPEGNSSDLDIDAVFGSARMWPWPVVYYRRLKKGPITIENYQRRVAQNLEFCIVDKYIRSSSGWGELDLEKQNSKGWL